WNEAPTWTLAVAGLTATVATGMGVTVTVAEPLLPSLVAVTVTGPPAPLPVTSPFASTLATAALPLCQVIVRPVSGLPTASCGVALSCTVAPTTMLAVGGATATVATGLGLPVTAPVSPLPSLVAVTVTGPPAPLPVTSPVASTLAIAPSLLCQVTVRPVSGLPAASCGVALSCTVAPTTMLAVGGATATVATGMGVTVTAAVPLFPSLVAVMVTGPPTAFPVTTPFESTVAIVASPVGQASVRPVSGLPPEYRGVAASGTVAPTTMLAVGGVTATVATGMGVTVTAAEPLLPSLVAVTVTGPPAPLPVTRPVASTVAIVAALVAQVTVRPVRGLPAASCGVAVSWTVSPGCVVADAGVTPTE